MSQGMHLVISSSLHPTSRSRILARAVAERLRSQEREVEVFDLSQRTLPPCDGATAYGNEEVIALGELVRSAEAIYIASPVYNYDVNAAIKNAVELTGKAWTGKTVSLLLAAGGQGSYMSAMGLANSLMLDFRCVIVPRFVYATGESFEGDSLADEEIGRRVDTLVEETLRLSDALNS
ncbi:MULTISPECIES: NADPH-dependent FMN reductase [Rhodopirellula]|jgi:NAD(P)H-dependent FMN reductase|uniref:Flavoprotein n=2 Tax=Rhodopirellula europaea TaxID=1263866 RepID=M5S8D2_9BACT|nr:NAD(P)H-dependent oxidoreductase [Rhodopirellula europaea]EMB14871.1 flavoprotein [Rhodopirellula europaea 6C]EMI23907.1 flavoprotein [Rhodopirellula europaea SH398]MCR9206895.1 NAD(P)H-dependent oxidoreductase [bacterium]|tara:strand:- start:1434 stop:1967 length:534 start_codon:yes stop_codon:yes gene_type:complete